MPGLDLFGFLKLWIYVAIAAVIAAVSVLAYLWRSNTRWIRKLRKADARRRRERSRW